MKVNMTNFNLIAVANEDFSNTQGDTKPQRVLIAEISARMIPPQLAEEQVKETLKEKFEEDLAQAYLTAYNLVRLGVDPYPIYAAVFNKDASHPIFSL